MAQLQIELTNACNAKCLICPNRFNRRAITNMDTELLRKIIDEVENDCLVDSPVGICGLGEPTMHPRFLECIDIVSQVPWCMGSNMSLMDDEKIEKVVSCKPKSFTVSLDGSTEKIYSTVRGSLNFNTVRDNTLKFLNRIKQEDRFWDEIFLQFVVTKGNVNDIQDYFDYWEPIIRDLDGVRISYKPICPWPELDYTKGANNMFPGPQDVKMFEHPKAVWGYYDRPFKLRDGCEMATHWIQIMSDGSYSPCCMNMEDYFEIGNVKNNTLKELFNSPKLESIKELQRQKRYDEIPFCSKCI